MPEVVAWWDGILLWHGIQSGERVRGVALIIWLVKVTHPANLYSNNSALQHKRGKYICKCVYVKVHHQQLLLSLVLLDGTWGIFFYCCDWKRLRRRDSTFHTVEGWYNLILPAGNELNLILVFLFSQSYLNVIIIILLQVISDRYLTSSTYRISTAQL